MILDRNGLILMITILCTLVGCAGTHGKIKSYKAGVSKESAQEAIEELCRENEYLTFFDRTDNSGINRPGYFDILINIDNENTRFKLHFFGNENLWDENQHCSRFSVIEINGKLDENFGYWSSERRKGIELFEKEVVSRLETKIGLIEKE